MSYAFDYETQQTFQANHADYRRIAQEERLAELGRETAPRRTRRNAWHSLGQWVFGVGKRLTHTPRTLPQG